MLIQLSRLQHDIRKLRCIDGIRKILCFKADSTGRAIHHAIFSLLSGKLRCRIHLNARLVGQNGKRPSGLRCPAYCRRNNLTLLMLKHKIMVIALEIVRTTLIRNNIGTDHLKFSEIKWCTCHIDKLAGRT